MVFRLSARKLTRALAFPLGLALWAGTGWASGPAVLVEKERVVEASPPPRKPWEPAQVGRQLQVNEIVAARELSRGVVRLSEGRHVRVKSNTRFRVLASRLEDRQVGLEIQKGEVFLHSRSGWGGSRINTPVVEARPKGTQFRVRVGDDGTTTLTVIEGVVDLENRHGRLTIGGNEEALVRPGKPPVRTAVIEARNTIQWCLYYPAVLHLPELALAPGEEKALAPSLAAYRTGDLLGALDKWPAGFRARSAGGRVYRAMVLLAVGEVDAAEVALEGVPAGTKGRKAVEELIQAVTFLPEPADVLKVDLKFDDPAALADANGPTTASEWLARSYLEQARAERDSLERALHAARQAWRMAPEFGYAAVRVAELEFSFGRTKQALEALNRGLELTPRNAQGWALRGFLLSARNRMEEAREMFEAAIKMDSALANGWLGRGLCAIRKGEAQEGYGDLQVAVTLEPNRALLHAYLGKAGGNVGWFERADEDLSFAKRLDPRDPTPWLYSSVLLQERNRTNEAIRELQSSIVRNDNRQLYRSRFLLDQDRAVRSANLAALYQRNGMSAVAVQEATRATESDYTNASAHLFLANSFDALRDPTRIELRYETPWFHELLLANLLSPVGGGRLSQFVSQQEYSKLLEEDGHGASILQEWRSDSESRTTFSVFGAEGRTSYGIDLFHRDDSGERFGASDERLELYAQFKHELTPDDTLYFLGKWQDQRTGDAFKTYDNEPLAPGLNFEERQEPGLMLAGWNHRWGPGSNTLVLAGRLSAEQELTDPSSRQLLIQRDANALRPGFIQNVGGFDTFTDPALAAAVPPAVDLGPDFQTLIYSPAFTEAFAPFLGSGDVIGAFTEEFAFATRRNFEIYTAELQHIQEVPTGTILAGARFQVGEFETRTRLDVDRPTFIGGFSTPAVEQRFTTDFERLSIYAYDYWNVAPWLTLVGGVSWDRVEHPDNFRNPPVNDRTRTDEELSGKLGFTLTPTPGLTIRGAYTEALGGVTFDESVTLEPVQVSGFNQAYRTVLSESLAGSVETPRFSTYGISVEGSLPSDTWCWVRAAMINQDVERTIGAFTGYDAGVFPLSPAYFPDETAQLLNYREASIEFGVNQLLGDQFAVGALYRITQSELRSRLPDIPLTQLPTADLTDEATLTEFSVFGNWNAPSGFFGRAEANWYSQHLDDDPARQLVGQPDRSGDSFLQLNGFLGYRFDRNRGEVSLGVLNITDEDYRLSPLTPYGDLARDRTLVLRCRLSY